MNPLDALISTGGGGFSGSSSSNTGAVDFGRTAFDNSGFVVNQGAPTWLVYLAIGAGAVALFLVLRRK